MAEAAVSGPEAVGDGEVPSVEPPTRCAVCRVTVPGKGWTIHSSGKKHKDNVDKLKKGMAEVVEEERAAVPLSKDAPPAPSFAVIDTGAKLLPDLPYCEFTGIAAVGTLVVVLFCRTNRVPLPFKGWTAHALGRKHAEKQQKAVGLLTVGAGDVRQLPDTFDCQPLIACSASAQGVVVDGHPTLAFLISRSHGRVVLPRSGLLNKKQLLAVGDWVSFAPQPQPPAEKLKNSCEWVAKEANKIDPLVNLFEAVDGKPTFVVNAVVGSLGSPSVAWNEHLGIIRVQRHVLGDTVSEGEVVRLKVEPTGQQEFAQLGANFVATEFAGSVLDAGWPRNAIACDDAELSAECDGELLMRADGLTVRVSRDLRRLFDVGEWRAARRHRLIAVEPALGSTEWRAIHAAPLPPTPLPNADVAAKADVTDDDDADSLSDILEEIDYSSGGIGSNRMAPSSEIVVANAATQASDVWREMGRRLITNEAVFMALAKSDADLLHQLWRHLNAA